MAKRVEHFTRPDYQDKLPTWQMCRDCYEGGQSVKARNDLYLPLLPGHKDTGDPLYRAYIKRAAFYNVMDRTVDALAGLVLRKDATIEAKASTRTVIDDLAKRITQKSQSLASFLMQTIQEDLVTGRVGLLLDMPKEDETRKTAPRPFWQTFRAEQIIGWRTDQDAEGMEVPIWIVVQESIEVVDNDGKVLFRDRWRELYLGENEQYTIQLWKRQNDEVSSVDLVPDGPAIIPTRRGAALNFIPFIVVGPNGVGFDIQKPPLEDMADINLSLYRTSADIEHARHYVAMPTHVTSGWIQAGGSGPPNPLPVGPGHAWHMPQGADAKLLEFTGAGLEELRLAIEEKKQEMASLGARLLQKNAATPEAAETVRMRQGAEVSALHVISMAVSQAFTTMLRWSIFWMGLTDEAEDETIGYAASTDFVDEQLAAEDINALMLALQAQKISYETWYYNLQRGGLTRPGVSVEEEIETITHEGGDPLAPPEPEPAPGEEKEDDDEA
jgi:hypothetical protein